jgi:asparagine synthase (glutamine-hydrolysing)
VCGICGIVNFDGAPVEPGLVERMTRMLAHRGPDSEGVVHTGTAALGASRLAILDLARGGQPMTALDGEVTIVHNGEILNHAQLRSELEAGGRRLRTSCDTEAALELYLRHGPEFAHRLRGMFATAIWDARERRLVLARDPYGIKPLFYRHDEQGTAFASELGALALAPRFSAEISREALGSYLAHNSICGPVSIFADVRKLPPGHTLVCQDGVCQVRRFSRPAPVPSSQLRAEPTEVLAEELRERLRDSVRAHLVSDVPVGVLLSGGVDSSILAAVAAEQGGRAPASFSVGFAERSFDELERARRVAGLLGTEHHEIVVEPGSSRDVAEVAAAFDEPLGDSSALPTYLVARLAARHVKVVLSGEGADELFGGYETYVADQLARRMPAAVGRLAPLLERIPSSDRRVSVEYRAKRFVAAASLPPLERHMAWKQIFAAAERRSLLRERWWTESDPLTPHRERFAETPGAPMLARLQDVDLGIYLVDDLLVKTDRMTMAHGLEARVPFLDPAVSELALALPDGMKVRGRSKKRLLRLAGEEWLPRGHLAGRKRGFSIPAAAWLRGPLEPFAREVLAPGQLEDHGFFEPDAVARLFDEHAARRRDHSRQLWGLMCFSIWYEANRQPARAALAAA